MSRRLFLWSLFALQGACGAFFIVDLGLHLLAPGKVNSLFDSDIIEGIVAFALLVSLAFTASELRKLMQRHQRLTDQIDVASGAFADVLETRFGDWGLTSAERDVAILALKGFSLAEMAELRATKLGTVKAQCASLYRKADVTGRVQLLSLFLDDLLADAMVAKASRG